jgi:hypothetical protein
MAASYANAAAHQATPGDDCYSPSGLAETLAKLRVELDGMQPSRHVPEGEARLDDVRRHVSNLIAAASNGTPPGAPGLWTLSIAVDYLSGHLTKYLEKELQEQLDIEAQVRARG